jgi:hypothetical protein
MTEVYHPVTDFNDPVVINDPNQGTYPDGRGRYALSIFPTSLIFQEIVAGEESDPQTVVLVNSGFQDLTINSISVVGDFALVGTMPTQINAGSHAAIQVKYTPHTVGSHTGGIYVDTGDAKGAEFITLSGSASLATQSLYDSAVVLSNQNVPNDMNVIRTNGYYNPGDGGGAYYRLKAQAEADEPGQLISNNGIKRWGIASGQQINVRMLGAAGDGAADDTPAFTATFAYAQLTKADVFVPAGTYLIASTFVVPDGVHVRGDGGGYLYSHNTKIVFNGTGTKSYSIDGATATSVANLSVGEAYLADSGTRGDTYKTNDFSVNFSAGIILGKNSGLHNLGIYPFFDGTDGYVGTDGRLSDDWDVGVWARNADWWQIDNCIVYGHWRKTALLVSSHDLGDGKTPSCEKGRAIGSHFQGFAGVSVRSPEVIVGSNWGFAGTSFIDCDIRPLSHQSGHLATSDQLDTPFASPSMCMEISGGVMRGLKWYNCTFIGPDDICIFFGKASELFFTGAYAEAQMIKVSGSLLANSQGSRMIATSSAAALMWVQHAKFAVDFTPYQGRDIGLATGRYTAAGVFSPAQAFDDDYGEQRFASWIGPRLRGSSQGWRVIDESNNVPVQITHDGVMTFGSKGGLSIPSDTTANLSSLTSSINTTGKFLNKLVFNSTTGMLMRANGGATGATWKDMLAGNTITPV